MRKSTSRRARSVVLPLLTTTLLAAFAPAQSVYDCDLFVTQESPENVLTFHGVTAVPTGVYATASSGNFMAIHHGNTSQPVLVGSRGSGVHEFHRDTGALIKIYNPGGGWQWAGVFAANGDVLIGDMTTNDIRRYNPSSGAFLGVFAPNIIGPADMVFGPNGNLFVCSYGGGGVYELNGTTGAFIALHVSTVLLANDILFMPDGRRIVTSMATNMAHVFDAGWSPVTTFAGAGWARPHGIDRSPHDGHIYVIDGVTQGLHRFHPTTYAELNAAFVFIESKPVDVEFRRSPNTWCGNLISFGPGCGGLQIGHTGRPEIGSSLALRLTGAHPVLPAVLTLGDSDSHWNGIPLPLPLALFGAPSCHLLASPLLFLPTATDLSGAAHMPLALPRDRNLIGANLYFQWFVVDPLANAWGILTSDGAACRVGG